MEAAAAFFPTRCHHRARHVTLVSLPPSSPLHSSHHAKGCLHCTKKGHCAANTQHDPIRSPARQSSKTNNTRQPNHSHTQQTKHNHLYHHYYGRCSNTGTQAGEQREEEEGQGGRGSGGQCGDGGC